MRTAGERLTAVSRFMHKFSLEIALTASLFWIYMHFTALLNNNAKAKKIEYASVLPWKESTARCFAA